MGNDSSCCVNAQLKSKDELLLIVNKYRSEVWYLPIYDAIRVSQVDDLMETCPTFYHQVAHYEQAEVSFYSEDNLFNKFQSMSVQQKQMELENLVSRCYVVLDQEQLPLNEGKSLLPDSTSRNLFSESIVCDIDIIESSAVNSEEVRKQRINKLREFNPQVLKTFSNFANFCEEIKSELSQPFSLFSQLLLNFKAQMLTTFESQLTVKPNINNLDFKERFRCSVMRFVALIVDCLRFIYKLNKTLACQEQYTFFTNVNLSTLVTSVIFEDASFYLIAMKIYRVTLLELSEKFKHKVQRSKNPKGNKIMFEMQEISTSPIHNQRLKNDPLYSSVRMLDRLKSVSEPILKLKVFHESGLKAIESIKHQINKAHSSPLQVLGAEQVNQVIMSIVQKVEIESFVIHAFLTHDFIHQEYRMGKLGCSLAPFLISIQKLSS